MYEEASGAEQEEMGSRIAGAFRRAYPEVPADRLEHMARNFIQVVNGVIEIGNRTGAQGVPSHMEIANGLVYWCVATTLEETAVGCRAASFDVPGLDVLMREVVIRVADWLLGLEVLREYPDLFSAFVKGAVAAGASEWETGRDT
ncbi:MAG: hypothetical protein KKF41_15360 [Actinobacteria bacterium]|nr:hypothetical protein [Actinomycetota bacterium]MBU1943621.1 hypothetical protein [Actinomycetota bacterium]MBU2688954.1 hypothetical protein [Actinomycetota bacterium]